MINMGYRQGEDVLIVSQEWHPSLGSETRTEFESSQKLARRMFDVLSGFCNVRFVEYVPTKAQHGVDVRQEVYEQAGKPDIIFIPTAFSLTHTPFRMHLTNLEARVATMPTFKLEMFEEGGPMDIDYKKVGEDTKKVAEDLRRSKYVKITGKGTDVNVEIDARNVHVSSGMLTQKGAYGNLPGAEAYVTPRHLGNSNGYFTVPKGWGGPFPLKHRARFYIKQGRFVEVSGETLETQKWIDGKVKPSILRENGAEEGFDVLAELGIGTNPNVTQEYIMKHGWNNLLAEKIIRSVHLANGNSKSFGGQNDVRIHQDWVVPDVTIEYL